jgi:hypothetical protein
MQEICFKKLVSTRERISYLGPGNAALPAALLFLTNEPARRRRSQGNSGFRQKKKGKGTHPLPFLLYFSC